MHTNADFDVCLTSWFGSCR